MPEKGVESGLSGRTPGDGVRKKAWVAPAITEHDVIEVVAAACVASPPEAAKTGGSCNVIQT